MIGYYFVTEMIKLKTADDIKMSRLAGIRKRRFAFYILASITEVGHQLFKNIVISMQIIIGPRGERTALRICLY